MEGEGPDGRCSSTASRGDDANDDSWCGFLESQYRRSVRTESSRLDGMLHHRKMAGTVSSVGGTWSFPVAKVMRMRTFQFCLSCFALLFVVMTISVARGSSRVQKADHFRFTALHSGNQTAAKVGSAANFRIQTGCSTVSPANVSTSETMVTISYPQAVKVRGFLYDFFGDPAHAPRAWRVEFRAEPDKEFQLLTRYRSRCSHWKVPDGRSKEATVELDTGASMAFMSILLFCVGATGSVVTVCFCWFEQFLLARRALLVTMAVVSCISVGTAIASHAAGEKDRALQWGLGASLSGLPVPFLAFAKLERRLWPAFIADGVLILGIEAVIQATHTLDCYDSSTPVALAVLMTLTGLSLAFTNWREQRAMRRRRYLYRSRFVAAWEQLCTEDNAEEALAAIADVCATLEGAGRPLQGYAAFEAAAPSSTFPVKTKASNESLRTNTESDAGAMKEVRSVDQLYALAAGASRLLRRKVQQLALGSNGMFPVSARKATLADDDQKFLLWSDAVNRPLHQWRIVWTPLKPEDRALEKVQERYNGQCARLLDICRESIVFSSLSDLLSCLDSLMCDDELEVVQVKNSMNSATTPSSGFKAVVVNLRFLSGPAQCLGLHGHTCELILLHQSIALCLTEELHRDHLHTALTQTRRTLRPRGKVAPSTEFSLGSSRHNSLVPPSPSSLPARGPASPMSVRGPTSPMAVRAIPAVVPLKTWGLPEPPVAPAGLVAPASAQLREDCVEPELAAKAERKSSDASGDVTLYVRHGSVTTVSFESTKSPEVPAVARTASARKFSSSSLLAPLVRRSSRKSSTQSLPVMSAYPLGMDSSWPTQLLGPPGDGSRSVPAQVLLEQYRIRTMLQGPVEVHERAPTLRESVDHCGAVSVFQTSFPIAAAMRKKVFPVFWALVAIATAVGLRAWPEELTHIEEAPLLRLTALQLRDADARPAGPILDNLRVLHRGCQADMSTLTVSEDYREYVLAFSRNVTFDEVVFETARQSQPETDPVAFSVDVSQDGREWQSVAASRKLYRRVGIPRWIPEPRSIPAERGAEVSVHLPSVWYIGRLSSVIVPMYAIFIVVMSLLHHYEWGRPATLAVAVALGVIELVAANALLVKGQWQPTPLLFTQGVTYFASAYWIATRESQVVEIIFANGMLNVFTYLVHVCIIDQNAQRLVTNPPLSTPLVPILCLYLIWLKRRHQRNATSAIIPDVELYDRVWDALVADPLEHAGLRRIAEALDSAPTAHRPRQTYVTLTTADRLPPTTLPPTGSPLSGKRRRRSSALHGLRGRRASLGAALTAPLTIRHSVMNLMAPSTEVQHTHPVATLGLLYRQAAGVYHLAQGKLREWCEAAPAGGMVPCKGVDGALSLWQLKGSAAEAGGEASPSASMPPLKGVQRASQKLMRAYGADASHLLDVCRFALVVDHSWELAALLEIICADADVSVVGAKNRLRDDFSSRLSAGFRDVHLNLVIETPESAHLGISTHVWELQLMLAPMCHLRNEGGHRRYVEYRDARAQ